MKIFLAVVLLVLGMCLYAEEKKDYNVNLKYYGTQEQVYSVVPVFGNQNVKTEWSASYDRGGIHFTVICYDPDIINASASVIKRDGPVWNDDCVEIFIKPNWREKEKGDYYHYIVSYNNVQTDEVVQDSSVDTYFESNVKYEKDRWTANIYIPFVSMGIDRNNVPENVAEKMPFIFNICRSYHPGKTNHALCSWTYMNPVAFHNLNNWGVIKTDSLDFGDFGTDTPVKIGMPETLNVGNNVFSVSGVKNPDDYVIKIKDFETGKVYEGEKGVCNIIFEEPGEHKFAALLYKGDILRCVSRPAKAEVKDLLSVFTVYPYYRDIVQSKDPEKVLRLKVGIGNTDKENLKLVWKLISDKVLYEETFEGRENREIIYDISSLVPGIYKYNVSLYEGDNLLREYEREFEVLEPSDYEVTFDRKRICYINGEPFFPIFLYHSGEWMMSYLNQNKKSEAPLLEIKSMLKDIADHGFNGAITQGPFPMPENYAVNTREAGMEICFEIGGNTQKEILEKARDTYNLYNDGLFYYTVDEPIGDRLKTAITEYSMLKEIDPHRPVGAAVCHGAVFGEANNAFDIMMPDNYIIRNNNKEGRPSFRGLLAFIESAMEPNGWRKPLWAVPQAFGWNGDNVAFGVPTREELRCQMYFYLVYGATGFAWYGYTSPERDETALYNLWHLPSSDLWDYFNVLNSEMKDFSEIIIKGESMGALKGDNPAVHSNVWKLKDQNYAIIVNPERVAETVTFDIAEPKPYFDYKYNMKKTEKGVEFTLEPLECVIISY